MTATTMITLTTRTKTLKNNLNGDNDDDVTANIRRRRTATTRTTTTTITTTTTSTTTTTRNDNNRKGSSKHLPRGWIALGWSIGVKLKHLFGTNSKSTWWIPYHRNAAQKPLEHSQGSSTIVQKLSTNHVWINEEFHNHQVNQCKNNKNEPSFWLTMGSKQ